MHKNICYKFISFCLLIGILFSSFPSTAATEDELLQQAEERKSLKIQSNEIPNWPTGPEIGAEAAAAAFATATGMPNPSHICNLCSRLWQHWILNSLSDARD